MTIVGVAAGPAVCNWYPFGGSIRERFPTSAHRACSISPRRHLSSAPSDVMPLQPAKSFRENRALSPTA